MNAADARAWLDLRVFSVAEEPRAFAASGEEERRLSLTEAAARLSASPKKAVVMGAFVGGDLVGTVGLHREQRSKLAHRAAVWGVYVRPEHRGMGLARKLLLATIDAARDRMGVRRLNLEVGTYNEAGIRLYERCGFVAYGVEPDALRVEGETIDELHMTLALTSAAPS